MVSKNSLRDSKHIFLIGFPSNQIIGSKLPSKNQVLSVLFFNMREIGLNLHESATLVIQETLIFWRKARIPTSKEQYCVKKLEDLYHEWRCLQKLEKRKTNTQLEKNSKFVANLNDLFDIAHLNALNLMKIEEDKNFLNTQRQKGRPGCMIGVDKKLFTQENNKEKRINADNERKKRAIYESNTTCKHLID